MSNQFAYARGAGLTSIAITDRDILPDMDEGIALSRYYGVGFIPGVELTVGWEGNEVHLLAYNVDCGNRLLRTRLAHTAASREAHTQIMLYKLRKQGFPLQLSDVEREAPRGALLSRIHIAHALIRLGFIAALRDAFTEKLIGVDGECYHPTGTLPAMEMIRLVESAGGVPVLAHPGLYNDRAGIAEEEIAAMKDAGLRGVEVLHACHTPDDEHRYTAIARRLDLRMTGGSACRGVNYDPIINFKVCVPEEFVHGLCREVAAA
jgi:predicted metal-dependent phosphoesterase TrpH